VGYVARRQFFSGEPTPRGEAFAVEVREGPGCEHEYHHERQREFKREREHELERQHRRRQHERREYELDREREYRQHEQQPAALAVRAVR
jgi:hypothetical protein